MHRPQEWRENMGKVARQSSQAEGSEMFDRERRDLNPTWKWSVRMQCAVIRHLVTLGDLGQLLVEWQKLRLL
jgi:hypothetical protein